MKDLRIRFCETNIKIFVIQCNIQNKNNLIAVMTYFQYNHVS